MQPFKRLKTNYMRFPLGGGGGGGSREGGGVSVLSTEEVGRLAPNFVTVASWKERFHVKTFSSTAAIVRLLVIALYSF